MCKHGVFLKVLLKNSFVLLHIHSKQVQTGSSFLFPTSRYVKGSWHKLYVGLELVFIWPAWKISRETTRLQSSFWCSRCLATNETLFRRMGFNSSLEEFQPWELPTAETHRLGSGKELGKGGTLRRTSLAAQIHSAMRGGAGMAMWETQWRGMKITEGAHGKWWNGESGILYVEQRVRHADVRFWISVPRNLPERGCKHV